MFWSITLLAVSLATLGGIRMAVAQTLIFGDEPIPDSEVVVQLDFYSRESRLGTGEALLKEGTITLGAVKAYRVKPETSETMEPVRPTGVPPLDRYLVVFPFTLHSAPGEREYNSVLFKVELSNQKVIASDLIPGNVFTEEDVKKAYMIGGSVEYKGVGGSLELSKEIAFTSLRPVITAFGDGESNFYWKFAGQSDQEVYPGARRVAVILEVPHDVSTITAVITYEIDVRRKWLDDWKGFNATTEPYSQFVQLNLGG